MEQISNPGNSSSHKLLPPIFQSESKRHSWARRKPDFLLQLSYILEIFNTFNHKWWIHPAQSLQTVHGWPLKAQWRPSILAILLSLSLSLYPLFSVYCLLFFLSLSFSFSFLFSFLYFIPMVDIRFLLFCNFTTAKLFNDCSRRAVFFFGLYALPTRCLINVQDKK